MALFRKIILESLGVSDIVLDLSKEIMLKVDLDDLQQIIVDIPSIFNTEKKKILISFTSSGLNNRGSINFLYDNIVHGKTIKINVNLDKIKSFRFEHNDKEALIFIEQTLVHELTHFLQYQKNENFRKNIGEKFNYKEYITSNLNSFLSKSNLTVRWLNYYLYVTLDVEIEAEIHTHYKELKNQNLNSTKYYTFVIQNDILMKNFYGFTKNKNFIVPLYDEALETYLDYFKEHFYRGLSYKEIYEKLIKRIEDGIETYKRKVYRLASKIENEKNTN